MCAITSNLSHAFSVAPRGSSAHRVAIDDRIGKSRRIAAAQKARRKMERTIHRQSDRDDCDSGIDSGIGSSRAANTHDTVPPGRVERTGERNRPDPTAPRPVFLHPPAPSPPLRPRLPRTHSPPNLLRTLDHFASRLRHPVRHTAHTIIVHNSRPSDPGREQRPHTTHCANRHAIVLRTPHTTIPIAHRPSGVVPFTLARGPMQRSVQERTKPLPGAPLPIHCRAALGVNHTRQPRP